MHGGRILYKNAPGADPGADIKSICFIPRYAEYFI